MDIFGKKPDPEKSSNDAAMRDMDEIEAGNDPDQEVLCPTCKVWYRLGDGGHDGH
jgi:hypothetical protein